MKRRLLPQIVEKAMSHFLKDDHGNASSSSKSKKKLTYAAEQQQQDEDGAIITLPLSLGPSTQNQLSRTEGVVSIQRYEDLQNEYAKMAKRYRFMHDEFAEMRIELVRLRQERDEAWRRKK